MEMAIDEAGRDRASGQPNQMSARADQRFEVAERAVRNYQAVRNGDRVTFGMSEDRPSCKTSSALSRAIRVSSAKASRAAGRPMAHPRARRALQKPQADLNPRRKRFSFLDFHFGVGFGAQESGRRERRHGGVAAGGSGAKRCYVAPVCSRCFAPALPRRTPPQTPGLPAELSNQAFALLNSLNATDADGNANPEAKDLWGRSRASPATHKR